MITWTVIASVDGETTTVDGYETRAEAEAAVERWSARYRVSCVSIEQRVASPTELLRHYVTGAVERGEAEPITAVEDTERGYVFCADNGEFYAVNADGEQSPSFATWTAANAYLHNQS